MSQASHIVSVVAACGIAAAGCRDFRQSPLDGAGTAGDRGTGASGGSAGLGSGGSMATGGSGGVPNGGAGGDGGARDAGSGGAGGSACAADGGTTTSCASCPNGTLCGTDRLCFDGACSTCASFINGVTCGTNKVCSGGNCIDRYENGFTCTLEWQCQSGNCVSNHCCASTSCGVCQWCLTGTCIPRDGDDPVSGCVSDMAHQSTCVRGVCTPCGSVGTICCPGMLCDYVILGGGVCAPSDGRCYAL